MELGRQEKHLQNVDGTFEYGIDGGAQEPPGDDEQP